MGRLTVDKRIMARALGLLFVAGATIGLISVLLPHAAGADEPALYSNIALAFCAGVLLLALGSRLPELAFHVALVSGTLLIARAILESGEEVSFYSAWFAWIGLYAFYFFPRVVAGAHVAFVGAVYAATLWVEPGSSPVARWITTMTTLLVAGILIDTLLRRAQSEAETAADSARSMGMVADVAHELAHLSDSASAGPALCEGAARLARAQAVVLWTPNGSGASLDLSAAAGRAPLRRSLPFVGPPAGAATAFTSGDCVRGDESDGNLAVEFGGHEQPPRAWLWQPVLREGVPIAVLAFYWDDGDTLDDPALVTLTHLLAAEAAATLERVDLLARLEAVARTDDLTGLPNRRAWQEQLPREIKRAQRGETPLSIAMLDLDRFKDYNDQLGHQAGDRLLKQAAAAWAQELRDTDLLVRYGGEEFALALPGCERQTAVVVVERLRKATPEGQTCSAGLVCWDGLETPGDLLGRADEALYDAKHAGRNRTVVADVSREAPDG